MTAAQEAAAPDATSARSPMTSPDVAARPSGGRRRPGQEMSLRRRLSAALIAAAVVLVVMLAAALWALAAASERLTAVTGTYFRAVTEADAGYTMLVDAETSVRGYALTGNPVTLETFHRVSADTQGDAGDAPPDVEADLVEELGSDHRVLRLRAEADAAAAAWYSGFAEPAIAAVDEGGAAAVTAADIEAGSALFDDVRGLLVEYRAALREARSDSVDAMRSSIATLRAILVAFPVAAVVVGTLLWVYLRRWVTDPLGELAADARVVAEGDVGHAVRLTGTGEVGEVARDVEQMRGRLAVLVTEARSAQAELEASHAQLVEQAEDLRRSNRDLEQFAYVASHDLQEPLRKVASFTQLLAKRYEGQLDERADQYIGFAVDGAKRMQRLINDLLGFSRVGRIGGEVSDVDMAQALTQATRDLQDTIEATGATIDGEGLPVVRGEEPLLVQLLANLVGNALKFRHPDRPPVVRLEARRVEGSWELACHDNGIGIDPQYADRVFVIFQRLHAKDVYEGTGIGLALCKKIVEYHNGHIWIDPDATEGATIRWTLPAAADVDPGEPGADGAPGVDPAPTARNDPAAEPAAGPQDAGSGGEDGPDA
ncbi:sensor histidine kinase [Actinotalea subterranea]|uniref:sensor histidine kinase n=1 Tax=Actinotalea subterranea TaxID=2607497 RepID=UPI001FE80030|nr:ATP-binding protein [Actinotalea subterranea]